MDWRAIILLTLSSVTGDEKQYWFHLPWACAVLHSSDVLLGACSIFNAKNVLVSPDNFNGTVVSKKFYQVLNELYVWAGSNYLNPGKSSAKPAVAQLRRVVNMYVATKRSKEKSAQKWEYIETPLQFDTAPVDGIGVEFNVGILQLNEPWNWSPYVRPIPLNNRPDLADATQRFKSTLYTSSLPELAGHLCVTYSWSHATNKIRYHQVSYLEETNCLELFCTWKLGVCNTYPKKPYQICFKVSGIDAIHNNYECRRVISQLPAVKNRLIIGQLSQHLEEKRLKNFYECLTPNSKPILTNNLKSTTFVDVCPTARGAALYCPSFNNSVYAILTTAPSCGLRDMPGVYTTLPWVVELYESVYKVDYWQEPVTPLPDPFQLEQKNEDYEGVN